MAMQKIQYDIGDFEGPLDLLLTLIQTHQVDIYEVSISDIIDQYLATIDKWKQDRMEVSSEFIVMASRLIKIKSARLLPADQEEKGERTEDESLLLKQLDVYRQVKAASRFIEKSYHQNSGSFYRDPLYLPELARVGKSAELKLDRTKISRTYSALMHRYQAAHTYRPIPKFPHDPYTVKNQEAVISHYVSQFHEIPFQSVIKKREKNEITTSFFAVLELYKNNTLDILQDRNFSEMTLIERKEDDVKQDED
ncbi:segregation and condensation protein A [Pseudoramibacter sp.]|jgi:segregation and condensation protein A|uniref:segregation and condensation protein A n=1 Tax=Pseudoramibacter sp. TaxID=2034862 RepID=UPI0025F7BDD4|nr:segregation/condensation protein A [Pseudoramibacter sp.]MCH4072638.1 segregation/condensation protein A [Pseudoramibacter sp.]MCH4106409.1 segregation/condensation protein A [Pseudoramibacter sp.]